VTKGNTKGVIGRPCSPKLAPGRIKAGQQKLGKREKEGKRRGQYKRERRMRETYLF